MVDLSKQVQYIKNVGPNRVKLLNKLNVYTLKDLITYFPRNHEDRSVPKKLINCQDGETVLIKAKTITKVTETKVRKLSIYKLVVQDETANCTITWFNQKYLKEKFSLRTYIYFFWKNRNQKWNVSDEVTCI